jgi:hypothetical protein
MFVWKRIHKVTEFPGESFKLHMYPGRFYNFFHSDIPSKFKNHCRVMSDVTDGCQFRSVEAGINFRVTILSSRLITECFLLLSYQFYISIPLGIPMETASSNLLKTASGKTISQNSHL